MPAVPGEVLLTTLFADVHYYLSDPSSKPQHHRFSRGSYLYIYHNPAEHRAKVEVANHAGTPDQDAFSGYLDAVSKVQYSYKQPTLCTISIDARLVANQGEWHLPSYDLRNEQKYLYKLNTLDVYLWTEKDAATFIGHLKAVIPADRLDLRDVPATLKPASLAEHRDSMSPVVQQLEKTAIGAQFPPRAESTASAQSSIMGGAAVSPSPQQQQPVAMGYNPAAPAAPEPIAYREKTPPPPDDGTGTGLAHATKYDSGPPQTQYANYQQFQQQPSLQNSLQNTPQQSYFPGSPAQQPQRQVSYTGVPGPPLGAPPGGSSQRTPSGSLPPPPPPPTGGYSPSHSQQQQYTPSFGPPSTDPNLQPTSPPPTQQSFNHRQSTYQPTTQYANYPSSISTPSFGPSITSPGFPPGTPGLQPPTPSAPPAYAGHTPLSSPGLPPPPGMHHQQHPSQSSAQQQAAGIAGYSGYNYAQQSAPQAQPGMYQTQGQYAGNVHSQLYRPTEAEAAHGAHGQTPRPQPGSESSFEGKWKLNQRVDKVEKGVGRFLKRLDKAI